jgi:carboxyl-terminal processing protease
MRVPFRANMHSKIILNMSRLRAILGCMLCVSIYSCADMVVGDPVPENDLQDFTDACATIRENYPYFQFKGINWDSVCALYLPRARQAQGDEIYSVLFDLLKELKDGHVELETTGGFPVRVYQTPRELRDKDAYNPLVVRKYFHAELRLTGSNNIEYGIMDGNIGYVYLSTFHEGSWINDFAGVLDYLQNTKGLIVDVRDNSGGTDITSRVVVGRFLISRMPYPSSYMKGILITDPNAFLQPLGPFRYAQPVVVLINGRSSSMAEGFAEQMKQIPTVTVLGDTTAGAGGEPRVFVLSSGRKIRVSTKDIRRYDGQPQEWNGIPPTIRVPQSATDAGAGRDKQLEYAIELLR